MDIKIKVGGVDAVVTVGTAAEAAELLQAIGSQGGGGAGDVESNSGHTETGGPQKTKILTALTEIKGNPSAKLVAAIASEPGGCTDDLLRNRAGMEDGANIGPLMSHISKCCKRAGIARDDLFASQSKRMRRGKVRYFYKIHPAAAEVLKDIDSFEDEKAVDFELPPFVS